MDAKPWLTIHCVYLKINNNGLKNQSGCFKTGDVKKSPLVNSSGWLIHDGIRHLVRPSSSLGNGNTYIIEQWFSASPHSLSDFKGIKNGAIRLHLLCYLVTVVLEQSHLSYHLDCLSNAVNEWNELNFWKSQKKVDIGGIWLCFCDVPEYISSLPTLHPIDTVFVNVQYMFPV